jgi:predicted ATPase/class 3 adenylate cyclase
MRTDAAADGGSRHKLPTGLVTFLFTDIEDSSGLLQRLGDDYRRVLAIHDRLLRGAIADHGGIEVNTEGDAFFAVFTDASAAVNAAIAAQRALASTEWPEGGAVRVRMGLHTGEGVLGGDNYLGLDVHRAARVSAAAHGGQILVSETTRQQVADALIAVATWRELGAFNLKGIEAPLHLHQVTGTDLAADFPPPRAGRRGSLPQPRTRFVGRQAVLDANLRLLSATRVLVLVGPGGAGKTRLALELGRLVSDDFGDGVFFVPLEALSDSLQVPSAILDALSVPTAGKPADEALKAALVPLKVLLLLDNIEQLSDIATFIDDLLGVAPGLKVLATSRTALHLYGAQESHIPPLDTPATGADMTKDEVSSIESVELFVERARALRPDFQIDQDNASTVAEICRRLDGLPLAIELAAARIRLLTPSAILARLDQRLTLLAGSTPNLPPRQRSMRGAIEWSYTLLTPDDQQLLNRLSIFAGGWDLTAAEAICEGDPLEGIGLLLDNSLIDRQADVAERFRLLQTIQEYARERLVESGEAREVAWRHADYYRLLVESAEPEFIGVDPAACVARLAPDQDNIRAALDWTLESDEGEVGLAIGAAVWRLWQLRGQLAEGRRYMDALLALPSAANADRLRARALTAAGGILYWQGDSGSRERYQEALAIYEALDDEAGIAESYSNLGFCHLTSRPPDAAQALSHFSESLRRYEQLGDQRMVASLTGSIGFSLLGQGRIDEARAALERALELNVAGGYRGRAADNRFALGNVLRRQRRFGDAAAMYRAALSEAVEMADAARRLTYLAAIASWAVDVQRFAAAVRLGAAVRRASREQGGVMASAAGLVEPLDAARHAGVGEAVIAAEGAAGEALDIAGAVDLAVQLLDETVGEDQLNSRS